MGAEPKAISDHPRSFKAAQRKGLYRGVVKRVVDGDTLDVLLDAGFRIYPYERIRLAGVDTPEIYGVPADSEEHEAGQEAAAWVEERVLDQPVLVDTTGEESFGRFVARVWVHDEKLSGTGVRGAFYELGPALVNAGHGELSEG